MFALDAKIIYHFTDILSTVFNKVFTEKNKIMAVLLFFNLLGDERGIKYNKKFCFSIIPLKMPGIRNTGDIFILFMAKAE